MGKEKARPSPEKERTTEDDRPRPKVDARVKLGTANLHTSTNIHLRSDQIKALVVTTIAETPMASQEYGAIPLNLKSAGNTANRLMIQVWKRKRKKKRKKSARTSPEKERTTEDDRPRPKVDSHVKHGAALSHTRMNQLLRSFQTKALASTTIAETPMARIQYGAIPLILKSAGKAANHLMIQLWKRKRKKKRKK